MGSKMQADVCLFLMHETSIVELPTPIQNNRKVPFIV